MSIDEPESNNRPNNVEELCDFLDALSTRPFFDWLFQQSEEFGQWLDHIVSGYYQQVVAHLRKPTITQLCLINGLSDDDADNDKILRAYAGFFKI